MKVLNVITLTHILAVLIILSLTITAQTQSNVHTKNILATSVPKSGSFLLFRCIELLTNKNISYYHFTQQGITEEELMDPSPSTFTRLLTTLYSNEFLVGHFKYTLEYDQLVKDHNFKVVFIIRDPRDQIVSRAFYIQKYPERYPGLQHLSIEELITGLIGSITEPQLFNTLVTDHVKYLNKPLQTSFSNIKQFYQAFLPWSKTANCYTVKFEKLIGPQGGGTRIEQVREIRAIARHIQQPLTPTLLRSTLTNLFSNESPTFREGIIGSWKKYFTPHHKALFKVVAQDLLVQLEYEQEDNW